MPTKISDLQEIAKLLRYYSLVSTTAAGSGHPTSSMSAADIMATVMFGGYFQTDINDPKNPQNDRLIFSKGHASPLFYAIYAAAGQISEDDLKNLRQFDSPLEGHPTLRFPYTEAATGSLGQGLGIGLGYALNSKLEASKGARQYNTWVLLGDSEMAEGSVWEAMQVASYYKLNNLIAFVDVNRLGQRGETMYGHDLENYALKCSSFGWDTFVADGHDIDSLVETMEALNDEESNPEAPKMVICQTLKGKGVSFLEDKEGWHGKALNQEELEKALAELGEVKVGKTYKIAGV
jgi:transketolase